MKQKQSKPAAYFDVPAMNATAVASQLHTVCKDVEEAIKEKEGSKDSINPKQFGDRIRNLAGSSGKMGYVFVNPSKDLAKGTDFFALLWDMVRTYNYDPLGCFLKGKESGSSAVINLSVFVDMNSSLSGDISPIVSSIVGICFQSKSFVSDLANYQSYYFDSVDMLQSYADEVLHKDINVKEFIERNKITEEEFLSGLTYGLPSMS